MTAALLPALPILTVKTPSAKAAANGHMTITRVLMQLRNISIVYLV
jgi:hypothetical protein